MQISELSKYGIKPIKIIITRFITHYCVSYVLNKEEYSIITRRGQRKQYKTINAVFSDLQHMQLNDVPIFINDKSRITLSENEILY